MQACECANICSRCAIFIFFNVPWAVLNEYFVGVMSSSKFDNDDDELRLGQNEWVDDDDDDDDKGEEKDGAEATTEAIVEADGENVDEAEERS